MQITSAEWRQCRRLETELKFLLFNRCVLHHRIWVLITRLLQRQQQELFGRPRQRRVQRSQDRPPEQRALRNQHAGQCGHNRNRLRGQRGQRNQDVLS